jgi:hypothetical protein
MGGSNSDSNSTQQTSSTTSDNRVGADNGAVVIQAGAQQNISFSPEVADAAKYVVNSITDFSKGVVSTAGSILEKNLAVTQAQTSDFLNFGKTALAASPATPAAASSNISNSLNLDSLKIPLIIGGVLLAFLLLRKQ